MIHFSSEKAILLSSFKFRSRFV